MRQSTEFFDRTADAPPSYLHKLRCPGHWRFWKSRCGEGVFRSEAYKNGVKHAKNKGVFLDAGCGHSGDAMIAVKHDGFKSAIKVDLWRPYCDAGAPGYGGYFAKEMSQAEGERVKFIQGDIVTLTDYVKPSSVDFICCNAVLDLMSAEDRQQFYCECHKVLRVGGVLSVTWQLLALGHQDWTGGRNELAGIQAIFAIIKVTRDDLIMTKARGEKR